MRRHFCMALGLLVGACAQAPTPAPRSAASSSGAACSNARQASVVYLVDGKRVTCVAAMSVAASEIASVEVLKGDVAVLLYGPSAASGVVVIRTRQER